LADSFCGREREIGLERIIIAVAVEATRALSWTQRKILASNNKNIIPHPIERISIKKKAKLDRILSFPFVQN